MQRLRLKESGGHDLICKLWAFLCWGLVGSLKSPPGGTGLRADPATGQCNGRCEIALLRAAVVGVGGKSESGSPARLWQCELCVCNFLGTGCSFKNLGDSNGWNLENSSLVFHVKERLWVTFSSLHTPTDSANYKSHIALEEGKASFSPRPPPHPTPPHPVVGKERGTRWERLSFCFSVIHTM